MSMYSSTGLLWTLLDFHRKRHLEGHPLRIKYWAKLLETLSSISIGRKKKSENPRGKEACRHAKENHFLISRDIFYPLPILKPWNITDNSRIWSWRKSAQYLEVTNYYVLKSRMSSLVFATQSRYPLKLLILLYVFWQDLSLYIRSLTRESSASRPLCHDKL